MEASSRSSLEAGGEGEKRSGSVGDTPVSARTFNLSTYRKVIIPVSKALDYGTYFIKTPRLRRHCQVPYCKSTKPASRRVNGRWRCDPCIAKTRKGRPIP